MPPGGLSDVLRIAFQKVVMQLGNSLFCLRLVNQEAEVVRAGTVADHPDVDIHDGGEYSSTGSGNLAHAVSDKSDESQALGNSYTADALKLCQKSVAEN